MATITQPDIEIVVVCVDCGKPLEHKLDYPTREYTRIQVDSCSDCIVKIIKHHKKEQK